MSEAQNRAIWDDIVKAGWGPGYAGGSILGYLRHPWTSRDPRAEPIARWLYRQMVEHASIEEEGPSHTGAWTRALAELWEWLTPAEHARLRA